MKNTRPDKNSFFGNREDGARTKPARESSASSRIVQDICTALFDDTLHPGDYLGAESDLVEHYGVSRGPVRDALRTLEAFGVVDIRVGAHGGIFVASGDPTRFSNTLAVQLKLMQVGRNDLLDSLSAIEEFAVDLAARSATQEELDRLSDIIVSLKDVTDPEEFTALSFNCTASVFEKRVGSPDATNIPPCAPTRISTTPNASRVLSASRTGPRLTP